MRVEEKGKNEKKAKRHQFIKYCHPKEPYTVGNQIQNTLLRSWTNIFLPCPPIGFALHFVKGQSAETFVINLIAAIPLLLLNDIALVEISLRVGKRAGGLIYIFTAEEFEIRGQKVPVRPLIEEKLPQLEVGLVTPGIMIAQSYMDKSEPGANTMLDLRRRLVAKEVQEGEEEGHPESKLHFLVAIITLVASTVLLYFCIDYVVNSIDALTSQTNISPTFISLILFPIPNCDFTAIKSAVEDKLDDAMNCTIGKCLQTALLVTPATVLIAWGVGVDDVTLVFDGFEVVSLFASILLLNFLMSEGKVSWIQGILLLADWGLIALAAFYATA
ncbi:Vacuolar calcium ion transporter [Cladobotryum mycophilum]|uniref:Vacuolar calcium ion transporter n=1 Tax=Cladobotryum mycophilum TaxID=491253 RepID=A0ABR0SRG9_9HYPO